MRVTRAARPRPRGKAETDRLGRGVYQVMAMLSPFLIGDAKGLFDRLAREYVAP